MTFCNVRALRDQDRAVIYEIDQESFDGEFGSSILPRILLQCSDPSARCHILVAESDHCEVVGYIAWICKAARTGRWIEILSIAVRAGERGRRFGERLLCATLTMAAATYPDAGVCELHVQVNNVSAQRLYSRCAFASVSTAMGYYKGVDAKIMRYERIAIELHALYVYACLLRFRMLADENHQEVDQISQWMVQLSEIFDGGGQWKNCYTPLPNHDRKPSRILALHESGGSSWSMEKSLQWHSQFFGRRICWHFVEAPRRDWASCQHSLQREDSNHNRISDHCIQWIAQIWLREGPFDGIAGVGDAGSIAALLAALAKRRMFPEVSFVLLGASLGTWQAQIESVLDGCKIEVPSLHFIAGKDRRSDPTVSQNVAAVFEAPNIHMHMCGHQFIPRTAASIREISNFFNNLCGHSSWSSDQDECNGEFCCECSAHTGQAHHWRGMFYCSACWRKWDTHGKQTWLPAEDAQLQAALMSTFGRGPPGNGERVAPMQICKWCHRKVPEAEGFADGKDERPTWYCQLCWAHWFSLEHPGSSASSG